MLPLVGPLVGVAQGLLLPLGAAGGLLGSTPGPQVAQGLLLADTTNGQGLLLPLGLAGGPLGSAPGPQGVAGLVVGIALVQLGPQLLGPQLLALALGVALYFEGRIRQWLEVGWEMMLCP